MRTRTLLAITLLLLLLSAVSAANVGREVYAQEPTPTPWVDPIDAISTLPLDAEVYRLDLGYADLLVIKGAWGTCAILAQYGEDPIACQFTEHEYTFAPWQATP